MKKNKSKKLGIRFLVGIMVIVFLVNFISAFSVSAPYMENKQLRLDPGESKSLEFVLQNAFGSSTIDTKVIIDKGNEIISLADESDIYPVPADQQVKANVLVQIPENVKKGTIYPVTITFNTIADRQGFAFGSSIEQNFEVVVGREETQKSNSTLIFYFVALIAIVIAIVAYFQIKKRRQFN